MKILIVEDHLDVLDCLRMYFSEKGHDVAAVATAEEAILRLNRFCPDLAIVDMLLPKGHGRQVLQEIHKRGLPTRLVVVTGSDDLELKKEAKSLGASDYLFKPLTIHELDALFSASSPAESSA